MKTKKQTKKAGISLIVLVITIIVMIILAAAIILSLQSSGIIGKANKAKTESDAANMLEAAGVALAEYDLEKNLGELTPSNQTAETYVKTKLGNQGFTDDELTNLSVLDDGTVQILPTIPTGFVMSPYEGEQKISEGLVIYEATSLDNVSQADAMTTYNQYVWIPVDGTFERVIWLEEEDFQTDYTEPSSYGGSTAYQYATEVAEYDKMKASVEEHGGFYIARYEAGDGTATSERTGPTVAKQVVSKKGAYVYNFVPWGESMTSIAPFTLAGVENVAGAVYLSKNIYPEDGSKNVVSTLCYGVQWDAVINFMKNVQNPNAQGKTYIEDSTGMGYYVYDEDGKVINPEEVQVAGSNDAYKVKNVYDMAGNVMEWTMEAFSSDCRITRGGVYYNGGDHDPVASRTAYLLSDGGDSYGFRVALYLK